ncbi:hypothetical protein V8J36_09360 [Frigidibacter sp. MR17.14]|uniref:hypothetical protein n=1 Tax=Frigidibacter sp. MR17.14 TaxID=3126509 RepID=UPI0030130E5E
MMMRGISVFFLAVTLALPAAAIETCASGTGVVTPDGRSSTVLGAEGDLCRVQAPDGAVSLVAPEALMPDFGAVETVATPVAGDADLVTGYYVCGEEATGFEVEISDEGTYSQDGAVAGKYAVADGKVTFKGGALGGKVLAVSGGMLALPQDGGAPLACELVEE